MSKKNVNLQSLFTLSEIISPSSDREKIKQDILSERIDWLSVVEIANTHFLTAALYYSLLEKNLLDFIDDEELLTYLEQIYTINLHRNQKIIEQSKEIAEILLTKDIKPVFLKGAASLLENNYNDVGIRFLSDIDLCVHEKFLKEASELLIDSGYISNEVKNISRNWLHLPPMYNKKWDIVIELHRYILSYRYSSIIPCKETNYQKSKNYTNIFLLTPTYRLLHAYIHSEIVDRHYYTKTIDLRQLYEMAILLQKYKHEIDWIVIEKVLKANHLYKKFNSTLNLIIRLFHMEISEIQNNSISNIHVKLRLWHFQNLDTLLSKTYIGYQKFIHAISKTVIQNRYGAVATKDYLYFVVKHIYSLVVKHVPILLKNFKK